MWLWLILTVAWAHKGDCPPLPVLENRVVGGALPPIALACIEEHGVDTEEDRGYQWVGWIDSAHRKGREAVVEDARALLMVTTHPDRALMAARALVDVNQEVTRLAVEKAWEHSDRWRTIQERLEGTQGLGEIEAALDPKAGPLVWANGLAAEGAIGEPLEKARKACMEVASALECAKPVPFPKAKPPPIADSVELYPCKDLGRLWIRARRGQVYRSELECSLRATESLPEGEAQKTGARLTVLLAVRRDDPESIAAMGRRVIRVLGSEPALNGLEERIHRSAGDVAGADWWASRDNR